MPTFFFSLHVWHLARGERPTGKGLGMARQTIVERVTALVSPVVTGAQLELVDIEYTREGSSNYLRIFIDKPSGVTLDDCQTISRECEVILDVEDVISTQYILEVSSPGLDRPLKNEEDYSRFLNRLVKIKTYQAIGGQKIFIGHLQGLTEDSSTHAKTVLLRMLEKKDVAIPYNLIASARLEVEF
jgi:ribosome maturation factor RimP